MVFLMVYQMAAWMDVHLVALMVVHSAGEMVAQSVLKLVVTMAVLMVD